MLINIIIKASPLINMGWLGITGTIFSIFLAIGTFVLTIIKWREAKQEGKYNKDKLEREKAERIIKDELDSKVSQTAFDNHLELEKLRKEEFQQSFDSLGEKLTGYNTSVEKGMGGLGKKIDNLDNKMEKQRVATDRKMEDQRESIDNKIHDCRTEFNENIKEIRLLNKAN